MKRTTYQLIIIALVLVIVIGSAVLLYQNLPTDELLSSFASGPDDSGNTLEPAPDFSVQDRQGNAVRLSDFLGKGVVLNFWATWCGPCQMEMPSFQLAWETYGDEVQFMIVNLTDGYSDTVESATDFINNAGYSFPVYFDTGTEAAMAYGTTSIPVTCFIDAKGNLVSRHVGVMSYSTLEQGIMDILSS